MHHLAEQGAGYRVLAKEAAAVLIGDEFWLSSTNLPQAVVWLLLLTMGIQTLRCFLMFTRKIKKPI
jgi:hypothetical protein